MSDLWPFQLTAGAIFYSGDLQSIGLRVGQKKNFETARFLTWFKKTKKRFFFCGIWDDWAVNSAMTMILKTFGLWCLKKIQKIFFWFLWISLTRKAKNPVFFKKNKKWVFFWRCNFQVFLEFFFVMHCRMAKNYAKLIKNYFPRL